MSASQKYYEIRDAALSLNDRERAALADDLFTSVHEREISEEEGAEWLRRLEELDSGKEKGVPVEEAMASIRERLKNHAQARTSSASD